MTSQVESSGTTLAQRAITFVRLGRPLHLAGGFVFHGLGLAIAVFLGVEIRWSAALLAQIAITATQLMTHYSNDYFDQDADAAALTPTRWSAGSRVLPDGLIEPRAALAAALVCGAIALLATLVLVLTGSITALTAALLLLSIGLAWSYSSPPLWLNRRTLGELTGAVLVPGLTTLIGFQIQSGRPDLMSLLAVVPLVFFQFNMLLSVNFPDAAGDARVNKRTLVVVLGPERAANLFLVCLALAYLSLPVLVMSGLPLVVAGAVMATLPIAIWQAWRIGKGAATDPAQWNALAFWSIGLLMAAALLETAAFLWLARAGSA